MKSSVPEHKAKSCPYCGGLGPFSREHIFPEWLCRIRGPRGTNVNYSAAFPEKAILSDTVIGDVCGRPCNNNVLSKLDEYAKKVLVPALSAADSGGAVDLCVDRNRLLRWVLKVLFNCARATDVELARHYEQLVPFITGEADQTPVCIDLWIAVVSQVRSTERERTAGAGETVGTGDDKICYLGCFGDDVEFAPCLFVGPLIHQVLIWSRGTDRAGRRRLFNKWHDEMQFERISELSRAVHIEPSTLDARTSMYEITMYRPDIGVEGRK